jgi:trehalose-phosphatase
VIPSALNRWSEIERRLAGHEEWLLLLDYDGTLSPIVSEPDAAALAPATRGTLSALCGMPGVTVAVVSGRALRDVEERVRLDIIYAGNHGMEIRGRGLEFVEPKAEALSVELPALTASIGEELAGIDGALVENKGLTASVHYRMVAEEHWARVRSIVEEELLPYAGRFVLRHGKKVFEIRPAVKWNKAAAGLWLASRATSGDPAVVCIGDDETDEDMFRAFPGGVTVRVGSAAPSAARYRVEDCTEVLRLLECMVEFRKSVDHALPAR